MNIDTDVTMNFFSGERKSGTVSKLFTPVRIGPLTLRNRTIRSAAFEGMCPGNAPSQMLLDYHRSVAAGGIGMTTVAYASVAKSGLSFPRQLWLRPEIIPGLREVTNAVHREGAAAGIQIGHCGNMSHKSICGVTPISASSGFNIYSPTWVRGMKKEEIPEMARAYGRAVNMAREAGFDAVEVHAGHGYLISQFLSPYTNHRKDEYGGSLENRMRFMDEVMLEVLKAAGDDMAVIVKMNMRDGFRGGMEINETIGVARRLEQLGAHALVLSGGFVSKAPMYVMRGAMPKAKSRAVALAGSRPVTSKSALMPGQARPRRTRLRPCATRTRLLWSSCTTSATVPRATRSLNLSRRGCVVRSKTPRFLSSVRSAMRT